MNDAELARSYILDRLPEEERDACEKRFLFDPEFESVMLEEERALLDDYANRRLSSDDAGSLLHRIDEQPGQRFRLQFAEGLRRAAASGSSTPEQRPSVQRWLHNLFAGRRPLWIGGIACAAAAAIAVAFISSSQFRVSRPSSQQAANPASSSMTPAETTPPATAKATPPAQSATAGSAPKASAAARNVATFVLLADQSRGDAQETAIALPAGATELRLQLTTEEGLDAGSYDAVLSDARGGAPFTATGLRTREEAGRGYVALDVPAARLSSGECKVTLTRERATDAGVPLGFSFALSVQSGNTTPKSDR